VAGPIYRWEVEVDMGRLLTVTAVTSPDILPGSALNLLESSLVLPERSTPGLEISPVEMERAASLSIYLGGAGTYTKE